MASPGPEDVALAERAFADGRYEDARAHFETALADGAVPRGPLLYDLGNCCFRLGRYAEAVLFYRRAQRYLPGESKVIFNRRLAERELGIDARSDDMFSTAVRDLPALIAPGVALALVALLELIGLAGLVLLHRRAAWRNAMALLVLIALAAAAHLVHARLQTPDTGVVLDSEIGLRSEPHRTLPVISKLRAGQTVEVLEASDRWIRVAHEAGAGWTTRTGVGMVEGG